MQKDKRRACSPRSKGEMKQGNGQKKRRTEKRMKKREEQWNENKLATKNWHLKRGKNKKTVKQDGNKRRK